MHQRRQRIRDERFATSQQVIKHDPRRKQIGAAIHRLAAQLFRCHVQRRPQQIAGVGQIRIADVGDAKVGQGDGVIRTDQNVGWLDISMDYASTVRVSQGVQQLQQDGQAHAER